MNTIQTKCKIRNFIRHTAFFVSDNEFFTLLIRYDGKNKAFLMSMRKACFNRIYYLSFHTTAILTYSGFSKS